MNCQQAQRAHLLEQTGELGRFGARRLRRHLGTCEACRSYCAFTRQLAEQYEPQPVEAMSWQTEQILDEARRLRKRARRRRPQAEAWSALLRPVLIYGGLSLFLIAGLYPFLKRQHVKPLPLEGAAVVTTWEAETIDEELAQVQGLLEQTSVWVENSNATDIMEPDDINAIATALMQLEENS